MTNRGGGSTTDRQAVVARLRVAKAGWKQAKQDGNGTRMKMFGKQIKELETLLRSLS